jgi:hypothetical protein
VSLTCSGAPANTTCSLSPASVTPSGGAAASTLTVQTNVKTAALNVPTAWNSSRSSISLALLGGGSLFWLVRRRKLKKTGWQLSQLALAIVLILAGTVVGCGGSGIPSTPTTPTGSYQITVTAAAGSNSHSATFDLTVQ